MNDVFNAKEFSGLVDNVGDLERRLKAAYGDLRAAEEHKGIVNEGSAQEEIEKAQSTLKMLEDNYREVPDRVRDYLRGHKPIIDVEYVKEQNSYQIVLRCPSFEPDIETLESIKSAVQFSRLYVGGKVEDKIKCHKLYPTITGDNFGPNIGARGDISIHAIGPGFGISGWSRVRRVIGGKENPKGYLQLVGYHCGPLGFDGALAVRNMLMKIKEEGLILVNIEYRNMKENDLKVA